jgi:hypothetical protein
MAKALIITEQLMEARCNLAQPMVSPTTARLTPVMVMIAAIGPLDVTSHRHVPHFATGQIPKAHSFWSVTSYDEQYDLVQNPLARLTLYLHAEPPAKGNMANWLPVPYGTFNLFIRAKGQDLLNARL